MRRVRLLTYTYSYPSKSKLQIRVITHHTVESRLLAFLTFFAGTLLSLTFASFRLPITEVGKLFAQRVALEKILKQKAALLRKAK